ncbi:hypothetical protein EDD21DRAFT_366000 [Dissophora ornata]|nr:hypothetical protein EDD21DRAFT_366000 [Dissophora ornata]
MLSTKVFSSSVLRPATSALRQQQACAFSLSTKRQEQEFVGVATSTKTPFRSPRYLLEVAERQKRGAGRSGGRHDAPGDGSSAGAESSTGRFNSKRPYRPKDNRSSSSSNAIPPSRFQPPPSIPYDSKTELKFADKIDWEVSSVVESRPLYANVAASRGTVAPLGTIAVNGDNYNPLLPGTAFSAHITGVRANGDLDPEVEQSLIQDLASIQGDKEKDHRKKSDIPSVENRSFLLRMSQNYQEVLNPRNVVNRFNNGNAKNVAGITYENGSDEVEQAQGDQQAEKSWKRLERLGGDYTRASDPLSLLSSSKPGENAQDLLKHISQTVGQNQSIGLEDKKKLLKAMEKGLAGY